MASTCKEILMSGNRKGEECGKAARECVEGHPNAVCSLHKNSIVKRMADKTKSSGTKTGTTDAVLVLEGTAYKINKEKKKYTTSLENIIAIMQSADSDPEMPLTHHDKSQILALADEEQFAVETIMRIAISNSSSTSTKLDYRSIACKIPDAYKGYQIAKLVRENNQLITTNISIIPSRSGARKQTIDNEISDEKIINVKNHDYCGIIQLFFKNVNVSIANCRFVDMNQWINNPNNIYMGSSYDIGYNDNEWFIPLDFQKYPSREVQNEHDVKRILDNINTGKEDKGKYLNLIGKTLGCLCIPNVCHCEVYIEVIKHLKSS